MKEISNNVIFEEIIKLYNQKKPSCEDGSFEMKQYYSNRSKSIKSLLKTYGYKFDVDFVFYNKKNDEIELYGAVNKKDCFKIKKQYKEFIME
jgi:hypothetical protein